LKLIIENYTIPQLKWSRWPAEKGIGMTPSGKGITQVGKSAEQQLEKFIFATRWILAPAYVVLIGCIALLVYKTFEEFVQLILNMTIFEEAKTIAQVLTIVDLVLVLNLVLMVLFVGYINFVSQIDTPKHREEDRPDWMEYLDYSGLKTQLLGSIIAVSSVLILRVVVELSVGGAIKKEQFIWMVIFHSLFLASVLIIAVVNKLKSTHEHIRRGRSWESQKSEPN
jgi:uncharacterized protein (TIGR00645 family)